MNYFEIEQTNSHVQFKKEFSEKLILCMSAHVSTPDEELLEVTTYIIAASGSQHMKAWLAYSLASEHVRSNKSFIKSIFVGELIMINAIALDDILDKSEVRNNQQTAHKKFGKEKTLLAIMYLQSFQEKLLSSLPQNYTKVVAVLNEAHTAVQVGQFITGKNYSKFLSIEELEKIALLKSGKLFAACLVIPILFEKDFNVKDFDKYKNIGESIGIFLQHINDYTDMAWNESEKRRPGFEDLQNNQNNIVFSVSKDMALNDEGFVVRLEKLWARNELENEINSNQNEKQNIVEFFSDHSELGCILAETKAYLEGKLHSLREALKGFSQSEARDNKELLTFIETAEVILRHQSSTQERDKEIEK